jgi:hypothetical protein
MVRDPPSISMNSPSRLLSRLSKRRTDRRIGDFRDLGAVSAKMVG